MARVRLLGGARRGTGAVAASKELGSRRAAAASVEAFLQADGLECCVSMISALAAAFPLPDARPAATAEGSTSSQTPPIAFAQPQGVSIDLKAVSSRSVTLTVITSPAGSRLGGSLRRLEPLLWKPPEQLSPPSLRQKEASLLFRAVLRTLGAAMRAPTAAVRSWSVLGGVGDFERLLRSTGLLQSTCSSAALDALLEFALPPGEIAAQPRAAVALLRMLPQLPTAKEAWRLVRSLRTAADHSEAAAVLLSRSGLCTAALQLSVEVEQPATYEVIPAASLGSELLQLAVILCRAWGGAQELRLLLHAATKRLESGAPGAAWLRALADVTNTDGLPLSFPYVWLRPPEGQLEMDLQVGSTHRVRLAIVDGRRSGGPPVWWATLGRGVWGEPCTPATDALSLCGLAAWVA